MANTVQLLFEAYRAPFQTFLDFPPSTLLSFSLIGKPVFLDFAAFSFYNNNEIISY
jgi:hypothetical protein